MSPFDAVQTVSTIGLDIAKSVFQAHGVDAAGQVVIRRQLKRRFVLAFFQKLPSCLIGFEACGSSHYWSRKLQALGHRVRLMPPAYVSDDWTCRYQRFGPRTSGPAEYRGCYDDPWMAQQQQASARRNTCLGEMVTR
jgi:hypothetical protein